ncbi:copper chaperone CopZ [Piscibacillus salipiscarius]|uniref:Copper chaperone CopZ n=1 Tax=Piscibacillus salipiscarius TaxID=299480 RepID=A0ABW5QDQ9_9BACI|nr:copper chaperone CopZ [Piscibacillus salipiscarius]
MKQLSLNVEGMSCGHCVSSVKGGVGSLDGVSNVEVDLANGKVDVIFDDSKTSEDQIKQAIDEEGYDVVA